jgi:hypothetical protein
MLLYAEEEGRYLVARCVRGLGGSVLLLGNRRRLLRLNVAGHLNTRRRTAAACLCGSDIDIFEAKIVPPVPGRYRQVG